MEITSVIALTSFPRKLGHFYCNSTVIFVIKIQNQSGPSARIIGVVLYYRTGFLNLWYFDQNCPHCCHRNLYISFLVKFKFLDLIDQIWVVREEILPRVWLQQ